MQMKRTCPSAEQAGALSPRRSASAAVVVALTVLLGGCWWSNTVQPLPGPSCGIVQRPTVRSISPARGPAAGGTSVTINGRCFTRAAKVRFGNTAAARVKVDSTIKIIATSPRGSGTVNVTVVTSTGTSVTKSADQFRYDPSSDSVGASPGPSS